MGNNKKSQLFITRFGHGRGTIQVACLVQEYHGRAHPTPGLRVWFEFSFPSRHLPYYGQRASLPYYLPIAGGRIIGFIPFPRVLALCEMQTPSPRVWTRITNSISYNDNHYITNTYCIKGSNSTSDSIDYMNQLVFKVIIVLLLKLLLLLNYHISFLNSVNYWSSFHAWILFIFILSLLTGIYDLISM